MGTAGVADMISANRHRTAQMCRPVRHSRIGAKKGAAEGVSAGTAGFQRVFAIVRHHSPTCTHTLGVDAGGSGRQKGRMTTQPHETAQIRTRRAELGRPTPRRFTHTSWLRFARDRRRRYLGSIPGTATDRQIAQIEAMVRLEWQAHKAEADGSLQADREAREFRRLLDRLLADFSRTVPAPGAERVPTLAEVLGRGGPDKAAA